MKHTAPLFSVLTPVQLVLWTARAVGKGAPAMEMVLRKLISKDQKARVFAGYEPTDADVFACCFSKSGTNWAMQLTVQIAHRGAAEFDHIHELAAWPESKFPGIVGLHDPGPAAGAITGKRVIKSALEAQNVPYSESAAYVTVLRDPKEVYVSAY